MSITASPVNILFKSSMNLLTFMSSVYTLLAFVSDSRILEVSEVNLLEIDLLLKSPSFSFSTLYLLKMLSTFINVL